MTLGIITLQEFLLSHEELAAMPDKGNSRDANKAGFLHDFSSGRLDRYKETFVAYQRGNLVGQSWDGKLLFKEATGYYGASSLTVFGVPKEPSGLTNVVEMTVIKR